MRLIHALVPILVVATAFTTLTLGASRQQDRFQIDPLRDMDSIHGAATVKFDPLALIAGPFAVAYSDFNPRSATVPAHSGVTFTGELSYVPRDTSGAESVGRSELVRWRDWLSYRSESQARVQCRYDSTGLYRTRHGSTNGLRTALQSPTNSERCVKIPDRKPFPVSPHRRPQLQGQLLECRYALHLI